MMINKSCAW